MQLCKLIIHHLWQLKAPESRIETNNGSLSNDEKTSNGHTSQLSRLRRDSRFHLQSHALTPKTQILMPQIVYLQDLKYKYLFLTPAFRSK